MKRLRRKLPGHKPFTEWGRPLRRSGRGRMLTRRMSRGARSRDVHRHTSDTVWTLVEKMLDGDADAAIVLADVIEEGVSAGKTKFVKIERPGWKQFGRKHPVEIQIGHFAAITPGSQIVLFGVQRGRGYVSRYRIGDVAEYHSYNLVYFGTIVGISYKRVTIDKKHNQGKTNLNIYQFQWRNWSPGNLEEGLKRNREWTD